MQRRKNMQSIQNAGTQQAWSGHIKSTRSGGICKCVFSSVLLSVTTRRRVFLRLDWALYIFIPLLSRHAAFVRFLTYPVTCFSLFWIFFSYNTVHPSPDYRLIWTTLLAAALDSFAVLEYILDKKIKVLLHLLPALNPGLHTQPEPALLSSWREDISSTNDRLDQKEINVFKRSSWTPDLSPTKNQWSYLKQENGATICRL